MNDAIVNGLFALSGAIIGAVVPVFISSRSMKKTLQNEMQRINLQKEADRAERLETKEELYFEELLTMLSMVRLAAKDIVAFGHTDETIAYLQQSKDAATAYLGRYEKRNILYLPQQIRHEAAHILDAWRSFCADIDRFKDRQPASYKADCRADCCEHISRIEKLIEEIKLETNRDSSK